MTQTQETLDCTFYYLFTQLYNSFFIDIIILLFLSISRHRPHVFVVICFCFLSEFHVSTLFLAVLSFLYFFCAVYYNYYKPIYCRFCILLIVDWISSSKDLDYHGCVVVETIDKKVQLLELYLNICSFVIIFRSLLGSLSISWFGLITNITLMPCLFMENIVIWFTLVSSRKFGVSHYHLRLPSLRNISLYTTLPPHLCLNVGWLVYKLNLIHK